MPNSPCSATRTELSSSTSTTSVRLPRSGKTTGGHVLTEEDLKALNQTGNLGKAVDVVIDYRTKETKSCYLSKDPVTNELFHMPVEQARIPRKVKDYTHFLRKNTMLPCAVRKYRSVSSLIMGKILCHLHPDECRRARGGIPLGKKHQEVGRGTETRSGTRRKPAAAPSNKYQQRLLQSDLK